MGFFKREKIEIAKRVAKHVHYHCRLCDQDFTKEIDVDKSKLSDMTTWHQCGRGTTGIADLKGEVTLYSDTEKELI